jgi:hypothetical protein
VLDAHAANWPVFAPPQWPAFTPPLTLGRLLLSILWNAPFLDSLFLSARVALLGRGDNRSVDALAAHRQITRLSQRRVKVLKQDVCRIRLLSASRNVQIVLASGTASERPSPRKRINDSRSLITYSQRSSDNECIAWRATLLREGFAFRSPQPLRLAWQRALRADYAVASPSVSQVIHFML